MQQFDANSKIDITDIASLVQCAVSTAKSRAKSCGSGPFLFVTSESPKLLSNQFFHQILLTIVKICHQISQQISPKINL